MTVDQFCKLFPTCPVCEHRIVLTTDLIPRFACDNENCDAFHGYTFLDNKRIIQQIFLYPPDGDFYYIYEDNKISKFLYDSDDDKSLFEASVPEDAISDLFNNYEDINKYFLLS